MPEADRQVTTLVTEGRFREALATITQRRQVMRSMTVGERLVLAELLERTGQLAEARSHLAVLSKSSRLTDAERIRCYLLDGLLSKQMGHLADSVRAFQKACSVAERTELRELLGWCQLRLMGVSADLHGTDLDTSLLSNLGSSVERAASPSLSTAHRIFLAEYHAKRGELDASRHHSNLAESLLSSFPNAWLRGLLDLHQSCLSYLEGNYLESLAAARHALGTSSESGHLLTGLIAQADMAAAYLAVGQPARALACLSSALRQSNSDEQIFGLLLETLAEAQLVSGDLAGCSDSLLRASDLSNRFSQSRSTWHRAWNLRTEARLLQKTGRWQESLSLIRSAEPRESPMSRSFTKAQLETLEALALVKLGRSQEATEVIQRFVQESLLAPNSYRGSILPASAALLAISGSEALAVSQCMRALRIVGATGEAGTVVEVVEQLLGLLGKSEEEAGKPTGSGSAQPLWRPTSVVCHLDSLTRLLPSSEAECDELVAFMSSLAELKSDPLAFGENALRCLASMAWLRFGSVVQNIDGESRTVVSYDVEAGQQLSQTAGGSGPLDRIQVWLGSRQSSRYDLLLTPRGSGQAAAACHGVARLLASLRAGGEQKSSETRAAADDQFVYQADDSEGLFRSPAMLTLLASAKRVAPLGITVLLTGESGTGKEVVASLIHRTSNAPPDSFVAFNCATVPRDMVDSQLFGYRRGAFTGAAQGFRGVISAADGGTLLLDEVGELPLETQPKLLRFLDSGEIQALGEATPKKLRVRIIAATNADLERLVQLGRFREDLYYRLNVVLFRLPPLRERREEILPLAALFLSRYSTEFGKCNIQLSEAAKEHLLLYSWPGNIRQLSHEVRRLVALSDSDSVIDVHDLDPRLRGPRAKMPAPQVSGPRCIAVRVDRTLAEIVRQVESAAIADALDATQGRLDMAAKRLGLSRKGLYLKRHRLGFG